MIPDPLVIAISSALATLALVAVFAAGWYAARSGIARRHHVDPATRDEPSAAERINLADLRARMRRLEAIAAGIDP